MQNFTQFGYDVSVDTWLSFTLHYVRIKFSQHFHIGKYILKTQWSKTSLSHFQDCITMDFVAGHKS